MNIKETFRPSFNPLALAWEMALSGDMETDLRRKVDVGGRQMSAYEARLTTMCYVVASNSLAVKAVYDVHGLLTDDSSLYRHDVKRAMKRLMNEVHAYERRIEGDVFNGEEGRDFVCDFQLYFTQAVRDDLERLYFCEKQMYDRHRIDHSLLVAKMDVCRAVADMAERVLEIRCEDLNRLGLSTEYFHRVFSLGLIPRMVGEVNKLVLPRYVIDPTPFSGDKTCLSAMDCLWAKMCKTEILRRCIEKADSEE